MAEMPIEPRLTAALLKSYEFGCGEEMLSIAAMSSVEYPFLPLKKNSYYPGSNLNEKQRKIIKDTEQFIVPGSDHLTLLQIYNAFTESGYTSSWCDTFSLQYKILSRAKEVRKNLSNMLKQFSAKREGYVISSCRDDHSSILKCLVCGYFSHAAKLYHDGSYRTIRGNVMVTAYYTSVIAKFGSPPEWIIYNEMFFSNDTVGTQIREISKIDPTWLLEYAKHYYSLKQ